MIEIQQADFSLITTLVILAISTTVSYLLREKPPEDTSKPGELSNVPTCAQGTPYGIIFGKPPRFKTTMVLWYGGFRASKWEDGDGSRGYYYYLGMHLGLSHAHVDGVKQLWFNDRCFWPVYNDGAEIASDSQTSFTISQFNAWGGKHSGGGLVLSGDILYGGGNQLQNDTLKRYQDGDSTPYYRGITSIVFHDTCYWGNSTNLPVVEVTLKRTDLFHDGSQMWYIAKAKVDEFYCLNIIHVIYECLTSSIFGRGIPVSRIDDANFVAAADTLFSEKIGISYKFTPDGVSSVVDFIATLEKIMDGFVYYDHATGKYKIKLIRDDYVLASLTEYDEDDFTINTFTRQSYFQVPSETIVNYTDILSARNGIARDGDLAIASLQGEASVTQTFNWPMITSPSLAAKLATREQEQVSKNPAFLKLSANRTMNTIRRGDVFKISHPRLTAVGVTSMVVRAVAVDLGNITDGELFISVTEEVFATASATNSTPISSLGTTPVATQTQSYSEVIKFSSSASSIQIINESKV